MRTSVVIPSYNPALKLPETLERLLPQASLIDELVIIIDNNNYDDFAKSLKEKYSTALKIKIYPQPNSGRAKSRNRGAKLSGGDIIIFLDDDILAEKDLIEKHIQYHLKNPGIIVSGNGYRNPENADYDFGKFLINMENGWKNKNRGTGEITLGNFNFTACNMSIPKEIFQQLGGFDERFSDGEDFDFAVRALRENIKIIYDNTLIAWHNDWPCIDTFIQRHNEYMLAKIEILKAHPEYLKYFPNLQIHKAGEIKKVSYAVIRNIIRTDKLKNNYIVKLLPLKIKFLLYRIFISIHSFNNANTQKLPDNEQ